MTLRKGVRSLSSQREAGGVDRRSTDHGGHYIAVRFNGSHSDLNHFAQDANFNQGAYRVLEERWAAALKIGKQVHVRIVPRYEGELKRPYRLDAYWYVDGRRHFRDFWNEKGGKRK